jgi:soluble lytic murein transglycosylase-like protein
MSGTKQTRRLVSISTLIAASLLLATASIAQAQTCAGKLPAADGKTQVGGDKFRLITQACPGVAEPLTIRRSPQLDLYEHGSIQINMSEPVEEAPTPRLINAGTPPAPVNVPDRDIARVLKITPAITAAAQAHNIDPLLLHAIAHVESRHNANAVSPAGARGVMQVMPATGKRFGVADESTLFNANANLQASAAYLRTLRNRYGDDLRLVLAAYNAGEGAVDRNGGNVPNYPETLAYVRDVMTIYKRLTAMFTVQPNGTLIARNEQRGDK